MGGGRGSVGFFWVGLFFLFGRDTPFPFFFPFFFFLFWRLCGDRRMDVLECIATSGAALGDEIFLSC
jgi:hypothetical protein